MGYGRGRTQLPRPRLFLALAQGFGAWFGVRQDQIRFGFALAVAIAVHAIAFGLLAFSISDQLRLPEAVEPRFVSVVQPPPPPPDVRADAHAEDFEVVAPRFRPREPMGLTPEARQRFGDPALAVWKYLCNRDAAIGDAAQKDCPAFALGGIDPSFRDPLNRQGDVGAMFGAETATMSLEEAGRHKGWVRRNGGWEKPPMRGIFRSLMMRS